MSQHSSSNSVHTQLGNHDVSPRVKDPLQMVNLFDLVLSVVPLTMVEPIHGEESYATHKEDKLSIKSSTPLYKLIHRRASREYNSE